VNSWTVDDPARLRALRALGVDGVITNDPAAARAALGA
jgi:glycerophosphoryl diester phosphodiesterase